MYILLFFVFFFQAEDGIRDRTVTGVQTCTLPIYASILACGLRAWAEPMACDQDSDHREAGRVGGAGFFPELHQWSDDMRSEERRVGKERRYGVWRASCRKKGEWHEWV